MSRRCSGSRSSAGARGGLRGSLGSAGIRSRATSWRGVGRRTNSRGAESSLTGRRHGGNADVIRQELAAEKGILVSLRTLERAVRPYRQELAAQARATIRFETAPGKQLQIDFGERLVEIGGAQVKAFLFVATLGYSRRLHVRAF